MQRRLTASLAALTMIALAGVVAAQKPADKPKVDEAAVARARKTAAMLDDVYKNAIVLITDKYVHDESDFAAGAAAVQLFKTISDKGWHNVRLLDATGDPFDAENVAKDQFEKEGITSLKQGKATVEQVVQKDDEPYLRVMTPVPVVLKKCIMCHPHYEDARPGEPIGAISYTIPIE
ncbi:MAG: DUF3365 domain-containing protein [Planctomycetes bacterium]|nr:DUF3365 domain-containing protein [Planctomycetota bacterium]